mmetsp:Transcript_69700/g.167320  ORF Transcript_69700/g.167320 Transcript_69700/m.167320 type:complete len:184 (+) Transcript_69700:112-663(+)|eukprot:CAMPEP_0178448548 /NCGR_PEP_ID=MMETSP0689_2-20121128/42048_1 /TAXON_ID=160604 /ORGANISM="Amphidinium massartii, Strain CS-259" /LENGTH=183 /DNA_ID=CAMNT_0020073751 /DNA_START=55 /DNA_END=606 /DNA_ORIENTATION=-
MLLPMPAMPVPDGAAADYLKSRSPGMLALLVFSTALCAVRLVVFLDIMGSFIMGICLGLGWYGWSQDMHITFICYWGLMCLINGAFDLVRLIDTLVHSDGSLFSAEFGIVGNILSSVQLLIPLSMLASAAFAFMLYKGSSEPSTATGGDWGGSGARSGGSSWGGGGARNFNTFAGQGQRLGTT